MTAIKLIIVSDNNLEIVRDLIRAEADLNIQDKDRNNSFNDCNYYK